MIAALMLPGTAWAHNHTVDDGCTNSQRNSGYFYLGGPLSGWSVHNGSGVNNCHVWTTTIDESISDPVNWAAYYLPIHSNYNHTTYLFTAWYKGDCDAHFKTRDVRYRRYRDGTGGGVTEVYHKNQNVGSCSQAVDVTSGDPDAWNGSNGGYTTIIDKSFDPGGTKLGVDQVQWVI